MHIYFECEKYRNEIGAQRLRRWCEFYTIPCDARFPASIRPISDGHMDSRRLVDDHLSYLDQKPSIAMVHDMSSEICIGYSVDQQRSMRGNDDEFCFTIDGEMSRRTLHSPTDFIPSWHETTVESTGDLEPTHRL